MIADFRAKENTFSRKKLLLQVVGILLCLMVVGLLVADVKIYQEKKVMLAKIANYQKEITGIKKNNDTLKGEITNADNPDYLEKIAYEQLNEQKPGEKEYIFVTPPENSNVKSQPKSSWVGSLINWIKSKF